MIKIVLEAFPNCNTSESYTNKTSGEKVTTTDWHNIVVRNKLAKDLRKVFNQRR